MGSPEGLSAAATAAPPPGLYLRERNLFCL